MSQSFYAAFLAAMICAAAADFVLFENDEALPLYSDPSRDLVDDILDDPVYFDKFDDAGHVRSVVNKWETQNMTLEDTLSFFDDMDESDLPLLTPMNVKQAMKLRRSLETRKNGNCGKSGFSFHCKYNLGSKNIQVCLCIRDDVCAKKDDSGKSWDLICNADSCNYRGRQQPGAGVCDT